jgi:sialic acid synthase SpsE
MNFKIGKVKIGKDRCVIIAEAGVNHNCSLKMAEKLIQEASRSGADIIKFQTYKAEKLVIKKSPRFWKWDKEIKKNGTQYDSYSRLDKFGPNEYLKLYKLCKKYNIEFMSTPFDEDAVDMLANIGMKGFKIASCDITNFPLLKKVAKTKMPILLSTGASNLDEIKSAVNFIEKNGNKNICVMQCTLCYPTKPQDANLSAILEIKDNFKNKIIGLSDHTLGINIASASTIYGVRVIEKHFTYNKKLLVSADHPISIDAKELRNLRKNVDELILSTGTGKKQVLRCEQKTRKFARRSIVVKKPIKANQVFSLDNLTCKRPGTGISPNAFYQIIGKRAKKNLYKDKIITKKDFI